MRTTPAPDRPHRRRWAAAGLITAAALGAGALTAPPAFAADPVVVDIVSINDFHGRIEASSPAGGIASLATAVAQARAANPNTLFVSAGDNIGASTFTSFIQQDTPTIDTLNAAGLDVSAVGNHEFDAGFADLADRVIPRAEFPYLGANVYERATGEPALQEYAVEEVGGVRIGFVGAVTSALPSLVSPSGIADIEVRDIPTEVNRVAAELSDGDEANGEADVVVALVHEGAATTDIAELQDPETPIGHIVTGLSGVDLLITAHTHSVYDHTVDGLPVIQSGQYGERFATSTLTIDPDTHAVSVSSAHTAMWTVPPAPAAATPNFAQDPAIAAQVAEAVAFAKVEGGKEVGALTDDLNRALQPRTPTATDPSTTQEARGGESTLGNFVADVHLWAAQRRAPATQIAFMNPGGLRANLAFAGSATGGADGVVTFAEAAAVQPFANTLVTLTLTGAQVREVLEQQWQPAGASRPFLKLGVSKGLTYTTDDAAEAGSRVQNLRLDGVPIDPAATYPVVVNSFLASGGDNFGAFAAGTGRADSGEVDLQAMVDWFAANGTVSPDLAQRSIGVRMSAPASAQGYAPGESIQLSLSSLDFTTDEPPAGTVAVAIGDTAVGTAPIDRSLVANTDEAGRADLAVTVPAGISGTVPLTISTPAGTSIEVPITVVEPIASTTVGFANKLLAKRGSAVKYTIVVAAKGAVPTGTVTVFDGKTPLATATLTEKDRGRVKITLPLLSKGVHLLRAEYAGDGVVAGSTGPRLPLIIW